MIVSYSHNYIYIRPKKTGSTTIETVLSRSLGPKDLIAGKRSAVVKRKANLTSHAILLDGLTAHVSAKEIRDLVPAEFWEGAYKFASERHPYEKAVSMAFYRLTKRKLPEEDFGEVLNKVVRRGDYRSFDLYHLDGKLVVGDFIRHESLHADLRPIGERIGVAIPDELPQKKSIMRRDRRPAREILPEKLRQIVFEICREEFELRGYER